MSTYRQPVGFRNSQALPTLEKLGVLNTMLSPCMHVTHLVSTQWSPTVAVAIMCSSSTLGCKEGQVPWILPSIVLRLFSLVTLAPWIFSVRCLSVWSSSQIAIWTPGHTPKSALNTGAILLVQLATVTLSSVDTALNSPGRRLSFPESGVCSASSTRDH